MWSSWLEKWKHALVSHILQNQTKDPWRWQITQVDQDCAHVWKMGGGNEILLLWISLSFIWITWGHGYICVYIFFSSFFYFFHGHWCVHFFLFFLGHASWACHLFSLFFSIAHASIERYERERSLNMKFYFVGGWNMVANFQCRSLACGVHMLLIKQVWNTSH